MLKSSLVEILRTFSKKDIAKFEDFVKSPYHNKKSNVVKLFLAIRKFAPEFDDTKLTKEEAWKKIFPAKNYNYGIMKNLIHDLTKLAEIYLSHENFNTGLNHDRHLLDSLFHRQLFRSFNLKLKNFDLKNDPSVLKSSDYFYNKVLINNFEILYNDIHSQNPINIASGFAYSIMYFLDNIFDNARSMYVGQESINITYDLGFVEHIINYFEKNPSLIEKSLLLKFKFLGILFFRNNDEKLLKEQIICFEQLKKISSGGDKYDIYKQMLFAYEIVSRKNNKYERIFINHMIEMVDQNIYSERENTYVPLALFINIMFVCQRRYLPKLLKSFIYRNIGKVSPEIRESLQVYSYGEISYLEEDYSKALFYFSKTDCNFSESNSDNFYCTLNAKTITTICNYELNYPEQTLTAIDSSIHFLNNNKIIHNSRKTGYANFFKTLKAITLIKLKYDELRLKKIRLKINNETQLSYKSWLLEKIGELEARHRKRNN
jgi:hypothetical protein